MNRRLIASLALGLSLIASPALAKKEEAAAPAAPALNPFVNPDVSVDPDNILVLDLSNGGRVLIRLMPQWAPAHVERIKTLVRQGFYNGIIFHRVIDGFMAQTGDVANGNMENNFNLRRAGTGGSDLPDLPAEFSKLPHDRGTLGAARSMNPNSANSQFFINFNDNHFLNGQYTVYGRVISGMAHVDKITRGEPPANPDRMITVRVAADVL